MGPVNSSQKTVECIEKFQTAVPRNIPVSFTDDTITCCKCMMAPSTMVNLPCYHQSLCEACWESLNPRICPICEDRIAESRRIYTSEPSSRIFALNS